MGKNVDWTRLVKQAQLGDKGASDYLAEAARQRLRTDIYRLTLEHDLTQDIVQESLVEMFKILRDFIK
jgi:DNA-directed RNA polymerase specialized sigma24 family protein